MQSRCCSHGTLFATRPNGVEGTGIIRYFTSHQRSKSNLKPQHSHPSSLSSSSIYHTPTRPQNQIISSMALSEQQRPRERTSWQGCGGRSCTRRLCALLSVRFVYPLSTDSAIFAVLLGKSRGMQSRGGLEQGALLTASENGGEGVDAVEDDAACVEWLVDRLSIRSGSPFSSLLSYCLSLSMRSSSFLSGSGMGQLRTGDEEGKVRLHCMTRESATIHIDAQRVVLLIRGARGRHTNWDWELLAEDSRHGEYSLELKNR